MTTSRLLTSKQVCSLYKISEYTLRNWRRGWYTNGGKHWYFPSKRHLAHDWEDYLTKRGQKRYRIVYKPEEVREWVAELRKRISEVRSVAAQKRGK